MNSCVRAGSTGRGRGSRKKNGPAFDNPDFDPMPVWVHFGPVIQAGSVCVLHFNEVHHEHSIGTNVAGHGAGGGVLCTAREEGLR